MIQTAYYLQSGPFPRRMCQSDGTGLPLLVDGPFAADLIHFEAGKGVREHTHPGAHILLCVAGAGEVACSGKVHALRQGVCYLIPAGMPHAVRAAVGCSLTLVSVSSDHRPVDSPERLEVC